MLFHRHQQGNLAFEEMLIQMIILLHRRKERQDIELCQYAEKDRMEMISRYAQELKEKP